MGFRRAFAALLSLGLIAATGSDSVPIREARWIAPNARLDQLLTQQPPCLATTTVDILIGRIAFADPLLLGGQAARAGISCASCHRSGRGNPAFVFPSVSGPPGTADVTSSLFSSKRGDGQFNPKPIPDLTFDPPTILHNRPRALEGFIRGLIVEEFDGAEPPDAIVTGLAAYVRALEPAACDSPGSLTVDADLREYGLALKAAETVLRQPDSDAHLAIAMIRAARSRLGMMAERYAGEALGKARVPLIEADLALTRLQQQLREGGAGPPVAKSLLLREANIKTWSRPLVQHEAR